MLSGALKKECLCGELLLKRGGETQTLPGDSSCFKLDAGDPDLFRGMLEVTVLRERLEQAVGPACLRPHPFRVGIGMFFPEIVLVAGDPLRPVFPSSMLLLDTILK